HPHARYGRHQSLDDARTPDRCGQLIESIDMTRAMLVRLAQTDKLKVVLITSATTGEGKTSLASHLGVSLARAGFRTLLVDGDLRRPMLHRLFGAAMEPGLNEALRGQVRMTDIIRQTQVGKLDLIAAGEWHGHSTEALAQGRFGQCLAGVK